MCDCDCRQTRHISILSSGVRVLAATTRYTEHSVKSAAHCVLPPTKVSPQCHKGRPGQCRRG
ncbi:hypothetical protein E2C01_052745 [Portunus trituberculatus]|uniref:Uncharacterized protein n=1 Tax=Portunus trituberculatus TaxID=210409 RepID=A0A5B7GMN3_PORTR|nr:hypothetical protein [Portunus trituberculatus]